jgi:hypothetical protein
MPDVPGALAMRQSSNAGVGRLIATPRQVGASAAAPLPMQNIDKHRKASFLLASLEIQK